MSNRSDAGTLDRLSALLGRFRVHARLFHSGPLCGVANFDAQPGRGFLHVLRRGELDVVHGRARGLKRRMRITEPSLLFYPRAIEHAFHNPPRDGNDFTCAAVDFEGGAHNPLVRALPPLIVVPLARVPGLQPALDLLFAETDRVRCGSGLLADRLFEVVLIQLLRWLVDHPGEAGLTGGFVMALAEPRLARALVAVHASPGEPWPLERMAAQAGMSRTSFAVTFKRVTGTTPADYVADWRMTLAAGELRAGRPVKAIADELGYASASALSKAFKQKLGRAPRDWLRGA